MTSLKRVPILTTFNGRLPFSIKGPLSTPIWILKSQYKSLVIMGFAVTLCEKSLKEAGTSTEAINTELEIFTKVKTEIAEGNVDLASDLVEGEFELAETDVASTVDGATLVSEEPVAEALEDEQEVPEALEEEQEVPEALEDEQEVPEALEEPPVLVEDEFEEDAPYTYAELKSLSRADQEEILSGAGISFKNKDKEEELIQKILKAQEA
jgi:hypothetical protein